MFFELHDEKIIGYKKLSKADLGTSPTSHQTHIGLAESVLTFLSNRDAISEDSIFIYDDKFEYIDAYFDRIENPNGTFRSPKIRIGDRGCISVVSTIRGIVQTFSDDTKWYLVWFGLKNAKIVFVLFNNNSEDYRKFIELGINLDSLGTKSIDSTNENFLSLMGYIEQKVNINGETILKELEIMTQTDVMIPDKKFKAYDIEKANENNRKIGRIGEESVYKYLKTLLATGKILSYTWYNQEKESGLPYDFSFQDHRNNITYIDVKTTGYDFAQKMIFSSQEIDYIATTSNSYCIYRVYKNGSNGYLLRVCDNCKLLSIGIANNTKMYSERLEEMQVGFRGAKLAIPPNLDAFNFKQEIAI